MRTSIAANTHLTRSTVLVPDRKCANNFGIEWLRTFFLIFLLNSFNEVASAHGKYIFQRLANSIYTFVPVAAHRLLCRRHCLSQKRVSCHTNRAEWLKTCQKYHRRQAALIQFIEFWRWLKGMGMGRDVKTNKSIVLLTSNVCLCFVRLLSMAKHVSRTRTRGHNVRLNYNKNKNQSSFYKT